MANIKGITVDNTGIPLLSRIYEGASNDKVSVKDFIDQVEMKDIPSDPFYSGKRFNYRHGLFDGYA